MPDQSNILTENHVHAWHVRLDGEPDESVLSDDERARAARFRFDVDRRDFVLARTALRRLLESYGVGVAAEIEFAYSTAGKPELATNRDLRFNLAHTRGMAVIGLARGRRVGVDVERLRDFPNANEIVELYFAAEEKAAYQRLDGDAKVQAFFRAWTRKEAFVKAVGTGLGIPLDSFAVTLTPNEPVGFVRASEPGWSLADVSLLPEFIAALAVEGPATFSLRACEFLWDGSPEPSKSLR